MSEGRKKRYRKPRPMEEKRPVILAKRDPDRSHKPDDQPIQPKILQKVKDANESCSTQSPSISVPQRTIIVTKDSITVEGGGTASLSGQSMSQSPTTSSLQQRDTPGENTASDQMPIMSRPATVISSIFQINFSSSKFLVKNNKDFLVVGVVGRQGVGKSTIMNLLAVDEFNNKAFTGIFKDQESIFPIKIKANKGAAWPRTESFHMYITKDRMILLDSLPVLCNSHKKDEISSEIDDLHNIIILMSVCHLVIFVQNDYFDMNLMRLFQMAAMTKPNKDTKPFVEDYYPNVLFAKNRAKRLDFIEEEKENLDKMLKFCFKDSKLKIFFGETDEQKKQSGSLDSEKMVNCIRIPDIHDDCPSSYHSDVYSIVADFRRRVFMTPRNQIYNAPGEMTEAIWFELLTQTANEWNHFFFRMYKEARTSLYQKESNGETEKCLQ